MSNKKMLGIMIENKNKVDILDKIEKYIIKGDEFCHIVSLNPENIVVMHENKEFKEVVEKAQIKIIDGVGVVLAAYLMGYGIVNRVTGVELMKDMLTMAGKRSLRVLLIGAKANLAEKIADCYNQNNSSERFIGIEGIKDIRNPNEEEESRIFSIVSQYKPHLVFAAFGSPWQEIWFWRNRDKLKGTVCMGVGGAFDYLSGKVIQAPKLVRKFGFEWLFRLITQPWRFKRQLRLFKYIKLVFQDRLNRKVL